MRHPVRERFAWPVRELIPKIIFISKVTNFIRKNFSHFVE